MRYSCTDLGGSEGGVVADCWWWWWCWWWWDGSRAAAEWGDSRLPMAAEVPLFGASGDSFVAVGSSSMYVMSERGRGGHGPVWLRELRKLCKLCKLCNERRSSRSSSVDLNARITRSCKTQGSHKGCLLLCCCHRGERRHIHSRG